MQITHISNSFIKITAGGVTLLCDPWVGSGNHGGWHSFPEYDIDTLIQWAGDAQYVYISHLHSDHFDPDFLQASGLIDKIFIMKRFNGGVLKQKLISAGARHIIERESYEITDIENTLKLAIIPQMTSTSNGADDPVNYDLDTSLLITDGTTTFFNQVDNPLSLTDYAKVKSFAADHFGGIDIACFMCGAASEYPQCFIGIDRACEKTAIIERSLSKLSDSVRMLAAKKVFPAGGTYFIAGKFSALNAFIAQPSYDEFARAIAPWATPHHLEGGKTIDLASGSVTQTLHPLYNYEASIAQHAHDLYPYQRDVITIDTLRSAFARAKQRYEQKRTDMNLAMDTHIVFKVYDDLRFDMDLVIESDCLGQIELAPNAEATGEPLSLIIHIDSAAMLRCLTRTSSWNQTLSGSLCLFERTPNVFKPEVLFSLNFLVV